MAAYIDRFRYNQAFTNYLHPDMLKDAAESLSRVHEEGELTMWPLVPSNGDMMAFIHLVSDGLVGSADQPLALFATADNDDRRT